MKILIFEDFDILIDEKSYENTLVDNILYKTLNGAKPLHIRFHKIEGFIRVYDGSRYLVSFESEKYVFIYKSVRYIIGVKSGIHMLFFIIMQKSKLINTILCP